jgi:hypothetical protein
MRAIQAGTTRYGPHLVRGLWIVTLLTVALLPAPEVAQHGRPQHAIDPRLISRSLVLKIGEHVRVDTQALRLLHWPVEPSPHSARPIRNLRRVEMLPSSRPMAAVVS